MVYGHPMDTMQQSYKKDDPVVVGWFMDANQQRPVYLPCNNYCPVLDQLDNGSVDSVHRTRGKWVHRTRVRPSEVHW